MSQSVFEPERLGVASAVLQELRARCRNAPPVASPWLAAVEQTVDIALADVHRAQRYVLGHIEQLLVEAR